MTLLPTALSLLLPVAWAEADPGAVTGPVAGIGALWPLMLYGGLVVSVVGVILGLSWFLGPKHMDRKTGTPFESGMEPALRRSPRVSVRFYLMAVFFVIFDLEAAFLFAWAVAARELGWEGYFKALFFISVLLVALIWLWRLGALDWGPKRRRVLANPPRRELNP